MCVRCAVKPSAKAPTSSHTAGSTAVTGLSAALTVSTASSAEWTYSATKRDPVDMLACTLKANGVATRDEVNHFVN